MLDRQLNYPENHSFFLFGARGTGKSTLLRKYFPSEKVLWFDLLDPVTEDRFLLKPGDFKEEILAKKGRFDWVVVDEIQKCPKLLNTVHLLIESDRILFALTGSSARRLKQKGTNLLAGRAFVRELFPLTHRELGAQFRLNDALRWGTLPESYTLQSEDDKRSYLEAYALTYIKHEIQSEQWVRKLEPFRRFLQVAGQMNGQILNYSKIASEIGSEIITVQHYFEILADTLLGTELPAHDRSVRKRQRKAPKFYFFDVGVTRAFSKLLAVPMAPATFEYGTAFEQFLLLEMIRLNSYGKKDFEFSYLRTKDDAEIDFIVDRPGRPAALIEVKSSMRADERMANALMRFIPDFPGCDAFLLTLDPTERKMGSVWALPWQKGLCEVGL